MTIATDTARTGPYTGNSTTGSDGTSVFAYTFKVTDEDHLVVTVTTTATGVETVKTLTTHYSVSGVGDEGGGNITMVSGSHPLTTETITISRAVTKSQSTDLLNRGAVQPEVLETALDRNVQMTQDLDEVVTRSLKLPVSTNLGTVSAELPAPTANGYLLWNATATALTTSTTAAGQFLGGDGTVSLPYYSFTADPDTGMYRIGANNAGFAVNGSKILDISTTGLGLTGALTFAAANPDIIGGDTDGVLSITADTATNQGGNIKLYGNTHATKAQDIEFYADGTLIAGWDESQTRWEFQGNNLAAAGNLQIMDSGGMQSDGTDQVIHVSGSNTTSTGGSVKFYGESHATKPSDIEFYGDATAQLVYDDSASSWDFQANALLTTGIVTLSSATDSKLVLSGSASPGLLLTASSGDGYRVQNSSGTFGVRNATDVNVPFTIDGDGDVIFTGNVDVGTFTSTTSAPASTLQRPTGAAPVQGGSNPNQTHELMWSDTNHNWSGDNHNWTSSSPEVTPGFVTFGGSATASDVIKMSFSLPTTTPSPQVVQYTVQGGDGIVEIIAGLQINAAANSVLVAAGITMLESSATVLAWTNHFGDIPTVTNTSTGSGSTTLAITNGVDALDSAFQFNFARRPYHPVTEVARNGVNNDICHLWQWAGHDDAGTNVNLFKWQGRPISTTAGAVTAGWEFYTTVSGSTAHQFMVSDGFYLGNYAGATFNGAGSMTMQSDLYFIGTDPNIIGGDTDGVLSITADTATNQGGNIKLYGNTHASKAQDIEFYADATLIAGWDESQGRWEFQGNNLAAAGNLQIMDSGGMQSDGTDQVIHISGSNTTSTGGNVKFYGETHATKPSDIEFYGDATAQLVYDDSASSWDFQANAITSSGNFTLTGASDEKLVLSGSASPSVKLDASSGDAYRIQNSSGTFGIRNTTDATVPFTVDGTGLTTAKRLVETPGFINGDGMVQQRADATLSTSYQFGPDRWTGAGAGTAVSAGTYGNSTAAVGAFTAQYKHAFTGVTLTGTGILYHRYRMEGKDSSSYYDTEITISVLVYHDVGSNVDFTLYLRRANAADDFSGVTEIGNSGATAVVTATTTLLTYTVDTGATGISNGLEFEVKAEVGAITTKNLYISEWNLDHGPTATEFRSQNFQTELDRCKRYYQKTYDYDIQPAATSASGQLMCVTYNNAVAQNSVMWEYDVQMRDAPNVTAYSTIGGATGVMRRNGAAADTAVTVYNAGDNRVNFYTTGTVTAGDLLFGHAVAEKEL
jgi:hypothetical protein